jgi:hypothetical protein
MFSFFSIWGSTNNRQSLNPDVGVLWESPSLYDLSHAAPTDTEIAAYLGIRATSLLIFNHRAGRVRVRSYTIVVTFLRAVQPACIVSAAAY